MNRGDVTWGVCLAAVVALVAWPSTRDVILSATAAHPYLLGFVKFAILASMGELLAIRIVGGRWAIPPGPVWRAVVWGLLGVSLAMIFPLFSAGIAALMKAGFLPGPTGGAAGRLATALWVSIIMNATWAPTLMMYHRISDTWLDLAGGKLSRLGAVPLDAVAAAIDWKGYLGFVVFRTLPFFWTPAHTITFLLPPEIRVLFAAFLSLALGAILAFAKRRRTQDVER
jgi:hypothetical protein